MGLVVKEELCKFAADFSQGTVVIESDEKQNFSTAIEELRSMQARQTAIGHAAKLGCADPRINGIASPAYAINQEGLSLEKVAAESELPPAHPKRQVYAYRVDIPVCKKLV